MSERLIRALSRGGSVCWRSGAWCVFRRDDLRGSVIGELSDGAFSMLVQRGELKELRPGQFIWSGSAYRASRRSKTPEIRPNGRRPKRSALDSVLDGISVQHEREMAKLAVSRFAGDVERAAHGQRVTQNWDTSLHVDGVSSGADRGGRMQSAVSASRRLEQLADAVVPKDLRLLSLLIIEQRSLAAIARTEQTSVRSVREFLARALISLSEAYRLRVRAPR